MTISANITSIKKFVAPMLLATAPLTMDSSNALADEPIRASQKPDTVVIGENPDRNPKTVNLLAASKPIETNAEARPEVVKMKDGRELTRDEYFDLVISNATRDGILKSQNDFKLKDLGGREINDAQGYEQYTGSLKDKADQFKNPKDFSRFINGIRVLEDEAILTPHQIEFLIEYPSIHQATDVIAKLHGGRTIDGISIHQARSEASELIDKLETSRFKATAISSK